MLHQPVIDGFAFADSGKVLQGVWPVPDFPRLCDMLHAGSGSVQYSVSGGHDREGRPALRVVLRGKLLLRCQRCLQPLEYPVDLDTLLTLARSPSEGDDDPLDSGIERVVAGREMAVRELLEDELLLALPFAPSHMDCAAQDAGEREGGSPFAKLRGLMGTGGPDGRRE